MSATPVSSIGFVGLGNFGGFFNERLIDTFGFKVDVLGFDTSPEPTRESTATFDQIAACDIIIPSVPIPAFEPVVKDLVSRDSYKGGVIVDVCSVKAYPFHVLRQLRRDVPWCLKHPLFGPESFADNANSLEGLPIVTCEAHWDKTAEQKVKWLFEYLPLKDHPMTSREHDATVSAYQFLTQFFGRGVEGVIPWDVEHAVLTRSSELFHRAMKMVRGDEALFWTIYQYNPYCKYYADRVMENLANMEEKRRGLKVFC